VLVREATTAETSGILVCLSAAFEVYRGSNTPAACRHRTHPRNTPETLARDDRIRSNGEIRRDRWHDCLQCRQPGRRPHSRNGDTSQRARQRYCRAIVDPRGSVFPPKKLRADQPRYDRALKRAIRFYERSGFSTSGKVRDFFGMPLYEYFKAI